MMRKMMHATAQWRTVYCNGAGYIATAHAILQRRRLYCNSVRYIAMAHAISQRRRQFSPNEYSCLSDFRILVYGHQISGTMQKMTHATAQLRTLYCNGTHYIATALAILQRRTLFRNGVTNFHHRNTIVLLTCEFWVMAIDFLGYGHISGETMSTTGFLLPVLYFYEKH
jgi:hypothetical protein